MAAVAATEETLTWTSTDGRTWTLGDELDISGISWRDQANVAFLGDVVLVIGYQRDADRLVLLRGSVD